MIRHDFECPSCGATKLDHPVASSAVGSVACDCGSIMDVAFLPRSYKPFPSFVTTHIDGKPMEISSLQQIRKLEKERESSKFCWEPGSYNSKYGDL